MRNRHYNSNYFLNLFKLIKKLFTHTNNKILVRVKASFIKMNKDSVCLERICLVIGGPMDLFVNKHTKFIRPLFAILQGC